MAIPSPSATVETRNKPLQRGFNTCLLRPGDVPPSRPDMEVIGVFNPGVIETPEGMVLLVRVAEQAAVRRAGYTALPRWDAEQRSLVIDWANNEEIAPV